MDGTAYTTPRKTHNVLADAGGRATAAPGAVAAARAPSDGPAWVLLHTEAAARGFRNALAFKRWCLKRSVPLKRDGKRLWVAPTDVDRAVAQLPARGTEPTVLSAVAAIQSRRR